MDPNTLTLEEKISKVSFLKKEEKELFLTGIRDMSENEKKTLEQFFDARIKTYLNETKQLDMHLQAEIDSFYSGMKNEKRKALGIIEENLSQDTTELLKTQI